MAKLCFCNRPKNFSKEDGWITLYYLGAAFGNHLITLSETWAHNDITDMEFEISGYDLDGTEDQRVVVWLCMWGRMFQLFEELFSKVLLNVYG